MKALFYNFPPLFKGFCLLIFLFIAGTCFAQNDLPRNFEQLTREKFNQQKPEVLFPQFLEMEKQEWYRLRDLRLNPSTLYIPKPTGKPCENGDFESGTCSGWQCAYGSVIWSGGVTPSTFTATPACQSGSISVPTARQTPVSGAGNDPTTNAFPLLPPGGATTAMRIGNSANGSGAELISKTFVVTASEATIKFQYAVVFHYYPHPPNLQPTFWVRVTNFTTGALIPNVVNLGSGIIGDKVINSATDPWFLPIGNAAVKYKPWACAQIDLSGQIGQTVTIELINQDCAPGLDFGYTYVDNFCGSCEAAPKDSMRLCCPPPAQNLVTNGGFGLTPLGTGFTSSYTSDFTLPAFSSVWTGEYSVLNQAQAATVSPQWLLQDHGTCSSNPAGKFFIVNGKTGQTGAAPATIWKQTITAGIQRDSQYRFCAYMKNLPQCAFDVKPQITVWINNVQQTLLPITVSTTALLCNWQQIDFNFTATTNSITIEIKLDETPLGDGNDLAIDDISVTKLVSNAVNLAEFQITTQDIINPNDNFYQIIATPNNNNPLPSDCKYAWLVYEVDPTTGNLISLNSIMAGGSINAGFPIVTNWNYPSTNFPGYCCTTVNSGTPGNFEYRKFYRLILVIDCDCKKRMQWSVIVGVQGRQAKATMTQPGIMNLSDAQIRDMLKNVKNKK